MNGKALVFVVVVIIVLTLLATVKLGGDQASVDRARAYRIEKQTEAEMRAREADEARKQADWENTRTAFNVAKIVFFVILAVTLAIVLATLLVILAYRLWQASRSAVDAWRTFSEERARLAAGTIKVDRETRTFPALAADGAIHNLETGQVYQLGKPRQADPQQVTASAQVRALGVAAQAAEKIGKSTKDAQAADALPGVAASTPLVLPPGGSSTVIVESDTSETVDL